MDNSLTSGSGDGRQEHSPGSGANDFGQLALWRAATLAGMVTQMLLSRTPFFRKLMSRLNLDRKPTAAPPGKPESLPILADAIVGCPRETIMAVFGAPRSAVLNRSVDGAHPNIWQADTWYYALPRNGRLAMAICFADETARRVEFFHPPEGIL